MSREAVAGFLKKLVKYDALQAELKQAAAESSAKAPVFIALAAKHGFEFTEQELGETLDAVHQHRIGELSEAELRAVAGDVIEFPSDTEGCFD
jgi:predicted ribosomally synthesized peptide with nif11-like leader